MEMDQRDLENLKEELDKLGRSLSIMGDGMRDAVASGVREGISGVGGLVRQGITAGIKESGGLVRQGITAGIKESNAEEKKRKVNTDDSERAEAANSRLLLRHKEEYNASKEMLKTKEKSPEQEFQEKTLKTQFSTNSYLEQLMRLTNENNERDKKNNADRSNKRNSDPGFLDKMARYKSDSNPYTNVLGNMSDLGLQGKKIFGGIREKLAYVKDKASGSHKRQKTIDKSISEINREKALLSAEDPKLEKLKKVKGNNRDEDAIKEMEAAVASRKDSISNKSNKFADVTAEEYLYQKKKSDKNFNFKGRDYDLVSEQMRDNIYHSTTSDIFPDKKESEKEKKSEEEKKSEVNEESLLTKLCELLDYGIGKQKTTESEKSNGVLGSIFGSDDSGIGSDDSGIGKQNTTESEKSNGVLGSIFGSDDGATGNPLIDGKYGKGTETEGGMSTHSIFDIRIHEASNPSTAGEYIVGIYRELRRKNEEPEDKKIESEDGKSEGGGLMGLLSSLGPLLSSLGTAVAAIAPALAPIAVAIGGAMAFKTVYDKMEESEEGTTLGDVFAGAKSWLTTGDYEKGKEEHELKRYGGIKQKQADESTLQGARDRFDIKERLIFKDYENTVITKEEVDGLRETYASYVAQEIPASKYKAARNRLLKRAKEMQSIDSSTDAEFAELTGNDSHAKPNPSTVKEGSKEAVGTKSNTTAMGTQSGMDQMTAMTIQAKLIAMEMMKMNSNPDYVNKQKELMKVSGVAMA